MSVQVSSGFYEGLEWSQVVCGCGWRSAKLWPDKHSVVIEAWAVHETSTCGGGPVYSVREVGAERVRLLGELDRIDRERELIQAALEAVRS